jgi:hypothetical protein
VESGLLRKQPVGLCTRWQKKSVRRLKVELGQTHFSSHAGDLA